MRFGRLTLREAEGAILAHSLRLADGTLRKGSLLTAAVLERIAAQGIGEVIAARLEEGDVGEDEAARAIGAALAGGGIRAEAASTGRVNLYAERAGLFQAGRDKVDRLNRADPGITLATLDHLKAVEAGRMVATVKIIPYGVPRDAVEQAVALARGAISLSAYRPMRVGVVATQLPSLKASVMDKTIRVLEARLSPSGSRISGEARCAHDAEAVAGALGETMARSDMAVVFGASAICDIGDVIPSAILSLGGRIEHFGMPVDPGNLLLVGSIYGKPVLGAPGCARSPAENGFDWVLQRILAGVEVSASDITGMGVGGLLMEIGLRPQPREEMAPQRRIAAIILAAGRSTRMRGANKLLASIGGKAMVRHVAEAAIAGGADGVHVVTGHQAGEVEAALAGLKVVFVRNEDFAQGLSTSLAAGIRALGAEIDGALVLLGDMPGIDAAMVERMIAAARAAPADAIVAATHDGIRGNPVLWPRRDFSALTGLAGDKGAREMIADNAGRMVTIELGKAAGFDIDTPEALAQALKASDNG
jgi:molybdenum cofactor cytidylyltransferase